MQSQKGVVIVLALFIVALVTTMAYFMISRVAIDTHRTGLIIRNIQGDQYAEASISWAKEVLQKNWLASQGKPDVIVDSMPITSPIDEVNGYKVSSKIEDMQARYNVNNLKNINAKPDFMNLLKVVAPNLSDTDKEELVKAIVDWIAGEGSQSSYNKYYLDLSPPYRAPHQFMTSVSELRLVKGMTLELYNALRPYVTALPKETPINVQTASAPVLTTISPNMSYTTAQILVYLRKEKPFTSPAMFVGLDIVKNHNITADKITTVSNYFLVETNVVIENQRILLYTLLERTTDNGKVTCNIIWQSKNLPG